MKIKSIGLVSALALTACGPASSSKVQEAWNTSNDPALLSGKDVIAEFSKLPLTGTADQKGWSDDYWATYRGGIAYRWLTDETSYAIADVSQDTGKVYKNNSPAEKYDLLMNRLDFPTVIGEQKRTRILKTVAGSSEYQADYKIPAWEGICHGWAPAALNYKEPKKAVTVPMESGNSVIFYPSDIKALLSFYQQEKGNRSTRTEFLSERCQLDFADLDKQLNEGKITKEQWTEQRESSRCRDINAGSFHLVLGNELGLKKLGFVVDVTRDFEVWNQPVNSFKSKVLSESATVTEGAAPGTVKEITVETRMNYTVETQPSQLPAGVVERTKVYQYVLEIDAADKIIGGRWITDDRPDFAWRESTPVWQGYFKNLKAVYLKSIE